ncbi:MAG: hypothetical protein K5836_01400 [Clostridiales bacterium]|nr:hypothetical protein [Clostridiales bacterium]
MKRTAVLVICLAIVLSFAACGKSGGGSSTPDVSDVTSLTSMSDILSLDADSNFSSWDDENYIYAFTTGDKSYRAVADINADICAKIDGLDFADADYDDQLIAVLKDSRLVEIKDISNGMMSQDELDKYVGKTGQDLLDDGFCMGSSYFVSDEKIEIALANGFYEYSVLFDGDVTSEALDEDFDAGIADLTVSSITYSGLSDAVTDKE